jgi:hypothetical protein
MLVSAGSQSGKTETVRHLGDIRSGLGGYVVVFVCKIIPDNTILESYTPGNGWVRWKQWKNKPSLSENRVLLWPDTRGLTIKEAIAEQRRVFGQALDKLSREKGGGKWTVIVDEGLYFTHPSFLGFNQELSMLYFMGSSAKLTCITLTQRPSHLPLVIYSNITWALIGQTKEPSDRKRLGELGGKLSAKELETAMKGNGRHDFLLVPVSTFGDPEVFNLAK